MFNCFYSVFHPPLHTKAKRKGSVAACVVDSIEQKLRYTDAAAIPQEHTITTEWHADFILPTKITEPEKITEYTYDAQGQPAVQQSE